MTNDSLREPQEALRRQQARVHRIVIGGFILIFAALMWPIHPLFSRIHPMVLGMPFSLFYLIVLITLSFLLLLGLYTWEHRKGVIR